MSAWYLYSALGFYPVDPVSGEYVIGTFVVNLLSDDSYAKYFFAFQAFLRQSNYQLSWEGFIQADLAHNLSP